MTLTEAFGGLKFLRTRAGTTPCFARDDSDGVVRGACGAETWVDVATWAEDNTSWLCRHLVLDHGTPSHDTFGRVFRILDAKVFEQCFRDWISGLVGVVGRVVALDGKTLGGSRKGDNTALQMISGLDTSSGQCLGQEDTRRKGHEIAGIKA